MGTVKKIAVIGAGISGLCSAYWLKKAGYEVTVFEKAEHTGGSILTEKKNGLLIDLGPNSALETSDVLKALIRELGLEDQKVYANEAAGRRYVVRNGRLHPVPLSPVQFIRTRLFSGGAKLRLLREPFIKPTDGGDISLADFVRYRLGNEFLDYAINPFVAGVYAGDPAQLSTAAAFPKLYALEQNYGSLIMGAVRGRRERKKRGEIAKDRARLFSFLDGMEVFPLKLSEELSGAIHLNADIRGIKKSGSGFIIHNFTADAISYLYFDQIVLTVPAYEMKDLFSQMEPRAAERIGKVYYPPVAVVFMAFKTADIGRELDGFGFLVPSAEQRDILGSIWSSVIFPQRAPAGTAAFTTFVGGSRQPENVDPDDARLSGMVIKDLTELVGLKGGPEFTKIKRWQRAIPQYTMGYTALQQLFSDLEDAHPGLHLTGNYRRGIGLGDSVLSAREMVDRIIRKN